jgi:hypothetical protein
MRLQVDVHTEDGAALPWDAAAAGLQLRLVPIRGPDAGGSGSKSGAAAASAESVVLLPDEDATKAAVAAAMASMPGAEVDEAAAAAVAAAARCVCFVTHPLVVAGRYRVTAEFTETRAELLQALSKAVGGRAVGAGLAGGLETCCAGPALLFGEVECL